MRGQGVTEIWDLLGHKQICPTVTIEWLEPTVGLIRFLYPGWGEFPYRGVVSVHIEDASYEFKGMVFHEKDDAPTLAEHRAIKLYLASMGLIGKSRRLKNGKVVTKMYPGNPAQTNCGEMKMSEQNVQVPADKLLVTIYLGAENADGTLFNDDRKRVVLDRQAYVNLQKMVNDGVNVPLMQIGQDLAAKAAA
jgi:hypothetical protein